MNDDIAALMMSRKPTPERPLLGLTVLVVEDSRFACEAMRLLCLRSGARIRRADCLASARRHLSAYQPTTAVIDLGLPDGNGAELIRELSESEQRVPVILGTSGEDMKDIAQTAGADGFLLKPISNLAVFQHAILTHLAADLHPPGLRTVSSDQITPDPIALRDDLSHIATILSAPVDGEVLEYIAQFLSSLAHSAGDAGLADAASTISKVRSGTAEAASVIGEIHALVEARTSGTGAI